MRSRIQSDGPAWGRWLPILAAAVVVGGTALAIYGGNVKPDRHQTEQVVPNDRLPQ